MADAERIKDERGSFHQNTNVLFFSPFKAKNVSQIDTIVLQRGTASWRIQSRMSASSPRSVMTCTRRPRSSSSSAMRPPGNHGVGLGPNVD